MHYTKDTGDYPYIHTSALASGDERLPIISLALTGCGAVNIERVMVLAAPPVRSRQVRTRRLRQLRLSAHHRATR